jgi:hypothetical protein
VIVAAVGLSVMAFTMYRGYERVGTGWLLAGLPFAFVFGMAAEVLVITILPPKLEAYAEGGTWLKL